MSTGSSPNSRSAMSHYKDLRDLYARSLEYHGIGRALYTPVAASDMTPPCCGYFDRNGDFNLIANLSADVGHMSKADLEPLEYLPPKVADIGIHWQPKTSLGVQAMSVDTSANSPDNLPAGADAHIKYVSNSSFGAVLMTQRPVTLTAYNDERLFLEWLEKNKPSLLEKHGQQLKRYGMWIVTRTHTAPGCWINAWQDKKREAVVSLKAKASMLGGAGNEMSLDDMMTDRDWTHYNSKDDHGIVVFMDGIEVRPLEWKFDNLKQAISGTLSHSNSRRQSPSPAVAFPESTNVAEDSTQTPPERGHTTDPSGQGNEKQTPSAAIPIRQKRDSLSPDTGFALSPSLAQGRRRLSASPRLAAHRRSLVVSNASDFEVDEDVLRDVGLSSSLSRTASLSRATMSIPSRSSSPHTPSLRHERRSIGGPKDEWEQ